MSTTETLHEFLDKLKNSFEEKKFAKLTLGKRSSKKSEVKNVFIRPAKIKGEELLSFVYRHENKDITKNYRLPAAIIKISELLGIDFLSGVLFTGDEDVQILFNKKRVPRLITSKPSLPKLKSFEHDKIKDRFIKPEGKIYLKKLGITSNEGKILPSMNDKFRQINKYVEIIDGLLKGKKISKVFKVADMGAGKGYLTFALYDHLVNNLGINAEITGIEMRDELVKKCEKIANETGFENLHFVKNNIREYDLHRVDMLIALHACDTATDDAIFKGTEAGAKYIICAPCCHKQIRKEIKAKNELAPILKHGIFEERLAEMITDGLRALMLEANGYTTKVFEFISTEHTPKNIMLIGQKSKRKLDSEKIHEQIKKIKSSFGIEYFYLENLFENK